MKHTTDFYGYVSTAANNGQSKRFEYASLAQPMTAEPMFNITVVELFSLVRGAGRPKPDGRYEGVRRVHDEFVPVLAKRVGR